MSRRGANHSKTAEERGQNSKITPKDLQQIEQILEQDGFNARALTWEQLGYEANLDVCGKIIRQAMGIIEYHICLACRKGWVNKKSKQRREEYAEYWLQRYE